MPTAIAGLQSVSADTLSSLADFLKRIQKIPSSVQSLDAGVRCYQAAIDSLSSDLAHVAIDRTAQISADAVSMSLMEAVLLFDEFKREIMPLMKSKEFGDDHRSAWARRESQMIGWTARLQSLLPLLNLQLSILESLV